MKSNEAGAGQVGLLWVVFLIVLVLGLAGFTYIAFKDKADLEVKYETAQENEDKAFEKFKGVSDAISGLSKVAGFRGDSDISNSSTEAISDLITSLQDRYPTYMNTEDTTLEQVIAKLQTGYADLDGKVAQAQNSFDQEVELRKTAEENINNIEIEKNRRIAELEAQVADEQQRAQAQIDEDNERISNLQTQIDEAERRVREAENNVAVNKERYEKEITLLSARVMAQAKKLEVLREPDLPDGKILSASDKSGLAFIDVGRMDGLRRGTKFEVFNYGKGGVLIPKGWVEVRDVEKDTAKCGILHIFDELDPIVKGDVVINPHFARKMEKTFVFLGEFPSSMNKEFVKDRLQALGAKVEDQLSTTTDFLVLGEKEKGEFTPELADLPEYKLASQIGVQILQLKDLSSFVEY